jgi:hypothetical protein
MRVRCSGREAEGSYRRLLSVRWGHACARRSRYSVNSVVFLVAVGTAVADSSLAQIPAWNYGTGLPSSLRAAVRCGAPAVEREVELGKRIARWAPSTPL